MRMQITVICLTATLTATFPARGTAADAKMYPGAMCLLSEDSPRHEGRVSRDNLGRLMNVSDFSVDVICPIIRDRVTDNVHSAWMRVIDPFQDTPETGKFECTLFSMENDGDVVSSDTFVTQVANDSPQLQRLAYDLPGSNWGYHFIQCSIPGAFAPKHAGIVSYGVSEN